MKLVLFLIGRLFVILFALFIAMLAGSFFIGFGLASGIFPQLAAAEGATIFNDPEVERSVLAALSAIFGVVAGFQLIGLAVLPVTIAIAITELVRWRGMTIHLVAGGLCALFVMFSALALPQGQMPANGTVIVSLATGFVSAFFYWLIAGRNAGEWLSALGEQDPDRES